ncbi:hypothetical protein [Curtobacterium sp. 1310]|uniref:hypothetical protein n=1 Tax=Curtobacterium sp. 1310 TaxID=2806570 RepID=UPI001AE9D887|nr:hypothetical protein [Curtobacterium sp. 1310]MBP1301687.1 hypothetical protein [Curtobacterium sp. 1310]
MTELLPLPARGLPARVVTHVGEDLELADAPLRPELLEGIAENTAHASAAGTRRAYEGDWAAFERWCEVHGRRALPAQPQTVAGYITDRAALVEPGTGDHVYAPTTISRWVTSINVRHERENLAPPGATRTVKDTLAGIRRDNARPTRRMAPLLLNDLKRVLRGIDLHSYPACRANCSGFRGLGTVQEKDQPHSALSGAQPGTLVA